MSTKTHNYIPLAAPADIKEKLRAIAKKERRSVSQQALLLIELGLAEYERITDLNDDISAGKTQIDIEALERSR